LNGEWTIMELRFVGTVVATLGSGLFTFFVLIRRGHGAPSS
jgi:hypothetical protein